MSTTAPANLLHLCNPLGMASLTRGRKLKWPDRRIFCSATVPTIRRANEQLLVVVGGGAAGIFAAIRAKSLAPFLDVVVVDKGKLLSKVKISGGGRCNVTNGHHVDRMALVDHYPRGNKELRGTFFNAHGPLDTMSWFNQHDVELKTEEDGRVFPVSNNSSTVVDCLLREAKKIGVVLQTGKTVSHASFTEPGKFILKIEKKSVDFVESIEADYILVATGSSRQGYSLACQLGHTIVDPVPSLFSFKIDDKQLIELSGVTFSTIRAKLEIDGIKSTPQLTQVGPMLVTHWGLSGPSILRLSAWGARALFQSRYKGKLIIDFIPNIHVEEAKHLLIEYKEKFGKRKIFSSFPPFFGIVKRFWRYILMREGLEDKYWASVSNNSINCLALVLKRCSFDIEGKGPFKDEFVTAGGIPLSEISLETMQSRVRPHLFFAGEVLNVDGLTGGFNFQNAWTGGYIAGTTIGGIASGLHHERESVINHG